MANYYAIESKLNKNVIDILGAAKAPGTALDSFTANSPISDNQLWEFVEDPAGTGYYFIKSKLSGNVIDIEQGDSTAGLKNGALLNRQESCGGAVDYCAPNEGSTNSAFDHPARLC